MFISFCIVFFEYRYLQHRLIKSGGPILISNFKLTLDHKRVILSASRIFVGFLFAVLIAFMMPNAISAVTCPANTSPTQTCDDLSITGTVRSIQVLGPISVGGSGVTNSGTISNVSYALNYSLKNLGFISTLTNSGNIFHIQNAVVNSGTITTLFNSGIINSENAGNTGLALKNTGTIASFNNTGTISGQSVISNSGMITGLINSGTLLTTQNNAIHNQSLGTIITLSNIGIISALSSDAINNNGRITTFSNSGSLLFRDVGVNNSDDGTISTFLNSGTISAENVRWGARGVTNYGTITTLTNTGTFSTNNGFDGSADIWNIGTITTLNNAQGGVRPLTYTHILPTFYNIIITSPSVFGRLRLLHDINDPDPAPGTTTFGISRLSAGSSSISARTYTSVLIGVFKENLIGGGLGLISDISNGYTYTLKETGINSGTWDLIIALFSGGEGGGDDGGGSDGGGSGGINSNKTDITLGGLFPLSSIGVTTNPVFVGGTLVLPSGANSNQAFTVTSANGFIATPAGGTAELSGVISGVGGLGVNGGGTLVLSGNNSFSGGIEVFTNTTLSISGSSATGTGAVLIDAGGVLKWVRARLLVRSQSTVRSSPVIQ